MLDGREFACWVVQDEQPPVQANITLRARHPDCGKVGAVSCQPLWAAWLGKPGAKHLPFAWSADSSGSGTQGSKGWRWRKRRCPGIVIKLSRIHPQTPLLFPLLVSQSCPTLCDPMDCSLPGSSVRRISQARKLKWVAISFSRGSSRPREWTLGLLHCRQIVCHLSHQGSPSSPTSFLRRSGTSFFNSMHCSGWKFSVLTLRYRKQ